MAHEIESALFVGQPAWHGLGRVVREAPTLAEAITMAGLDWEVSKQPVFLADGRRVPGCHATIRSTDQTILGYVGDMWTPLQNREAFAWLAPLVDDGSVQLEAAGSLRNGQRVWLLAKTNTAEVQPGDAVEQYVLLSNGHDGKLAVRIGFTTVRVVCANTLKLAHETDANKLIRVQHFSNVVQVLDDVRGLMDVARAEFTTSRDQIQALIKSRCDDLKLRRYIREVFSPGQDPDNEKTAKLIVPKVAPLFEAGAGAALHRGSMWGAYNAVTEFVSHHRGKSAEARLNAQWFAEGSKMVNRAMVVALEYAAA